MLTRHPSISATLMSSVLVASPFVWHQSTQAAQMSPSEVSQVAKQVTVLISGQNPGSGVIIDRKGDTYKVLTAHHVVNSPDEYYVTPSDGQEYLLDYSRVKRLPDTDLAILEFKSPKTYPVATLGNSGSLSEGMSTFVTGFPAPSEAINLSIYSFTEGRLIANSSRLLRDGYSLVYSNSTQPGMSGGPVFNSQGHVIGIHGRADAKLQNGVYFKQNKNLGIAIDTFRKLAKGFNSKPSGNAVAVTVPKTQPVQPQNKAGDYYLSALDKNIRGDQAGALRDLNQAIALNPNYAEAYSDRSTFKMNAGDLKGAIADLDQAIRINPNLGIAYAYRGVYRSIAGNYRGANEDVNRALKLRPDIGYAARGIARWYGNDPRNALDDFNVAVQSASDSNELADIHFARGVLRWQLNDPNGALQDFNQALTLQPEYADVYSMRGILFFQRNQQAPSQRDFRKALSINPNSLGTYQVRSVLGLVYRDYNGVLQDAAQILRLDPESSDIYAITGLAYYQMGNPWRAIQEFQLGEQKAKDATSRQTYRELIQTFSQASSNNNPAFQFLLKEMIQTMVQDFATTTIDTAIKTFRPFQQT